MQNQIYVMSFPDSIASGARLTLSTAGINAVLMSSWGGTEVFPTRFVDGKITALFIADDCFFERGHIQWAPSVEAASERGWEIPPALLRFIQNVPASVIAIKRSSCVVGTTARDQLQTDLIRYHSSNVGGLLPPYEAVTDHQFALP